uniref:Ig-like domain-containing protein n=1 Tax=Hucho hucho TaxID=62062 RepID=A0A4W5KVB7_9TELE
MMSCEARGNPVPVYSWFINGTVVDVEADYRYSLINGNLIITNASETADYGRYQCKVENSYGTVLSRDALLQFACEYLSLSLISQFTYSIVYTMLDWKKNRSLFNP